MFMREQTCDEPVININVCVPGWLCQKSVTVQVETGEGIEGARYHGNTGDAAVAILHQPEQLHHTET